MVNSVMKINYNTVLKLRKYQAGCILNMCTEIIERGLGNFWFSFLISVLSHVSKPENYVPRTKADCV